AAAAPELLTLRTVHGLRALAAEQGSLTASLQQAREVLAKAPVVSVPTTVITAAAPSPSPRVVDARVRIDALHGELVAGNPRGRHVLAERSGHLVPLDQPEIISRCV